MNTDNNDHYRFMPHPEGEEVVPPPIVEEIREEISVEEEIPVEILTDREEEKEPVAVDVPRNRHDDALDMTLLEGLYHLMSPIVIPTVATFFIFLLSILVVIIPGASVSYLLTVFGATCVLPSAGFYVLRRIGSISSYLMLERRERTFPYIIETLALGAITIFFAAKGANSWIWTIYCGATAVCLANFIINRWLRISNHCSAFAALLAVLLVIQHSGYPQGSLFWWAVGVMFFAGVAGTLSILIGKHSIWEVLAGYATGFLGIILFSLIH